MAQNKKNSKKKAPKWNGKGVEPAKEKEFDMFLMISKQAEAKDVIAALKERGLSGLDVWEAMGVFSLEAKVDDSVDFEEIDIKETFVDASDLAFIKNRDIHSIFSFRATNRQIEALKPYFKEITDIFGGFVCSDSDDFQPMVDVNEKTEA